MEPFHDQHMRGNDHGYAKLPLPYGIRCTNGSHRFRTSEFSSLQSNHDHSRTNTFSDQLPNENYQHSVMVN